MIPKVLCPFYYVSKRDKELLKHCDALFIFKERTVWFSFPKRSSICVVEPSLQRIIIKTQLREEIPKDLSKFEIA